MRELLIAAVIIIYICNTNFIIIISTVCVIIAHRILGKYAYIIGI